jgi:nitrogen fixation NifU-like protein
MTDNLRELYQEIILDHNKSPRNYHTLSHPTSEARGKNPLCGDELTVYLSIKDNRIDDVSFIGSGCAISKASASLMTEAMLGKTVEEAEVLYHAFHHMLTDDAAPKTLSPKLAVLSGVKAYPARVKCATLAWHTLDAALHHEVIEITTE